jgi:predicted nucleotidyltransferase
VEHFIVRTTGDITKKIEREIQNIKQEVPEIHSVYGFGSFFRGGAFNDIDVLFVLRCEFKRILPASRRLRWMVAKLSAEFGQTFHSLVLTEGEFEARPLRDMHEIILIS